jgi:hypothetical protein
MCILAGIPRIPLASVFCLIGRSKSKASSFFERKQLDRQCSFFVVRPNKSRKDHLEIPLIFKMIPPQKEHEKACMNGFLLLLEGRVQKKQMEEGLHILVCSLCTSQHAQHVYHTNMQHLGVSQHGVDISCEVEEWVIVSFSCFHLPTSPVLVLTLSTIGTRFWKRSRHFSLEFLIPFGQKLSILKIEELIPNRRY